MQPYGFTLQFTTVRVRVGILCALGIFSGNPALGLGTVRVTEQWASGAIRIVPQSRTRDLLYSTGQ